MREEQCFCHRFCHPLAKEFQKNKFSLEHVPVEDFAKSQWQKQEKSICWLIYRWCVALCFCGGVLGSAVQQFGEGTWFIYLTNWGFFLCMATSIYGAILVSKYYADTQKFENVNKNVFKAYWALHWCTMVLATVITFVYWLFIHPSVDVSATAVYNLWAHAFNSILMLLDHMLVAFPTRLLHFVYPLVLGVIYGCFSIIYYFAGGVDTFGNRFIYEILDWSKPGLATATLFGSIIMMIIFCLVLFGLYKLRYFIYKKINNSDLALSA